ncbi:MAG: hypothetical protein CMC13_15245 [Flavobacteriaceae bacterium]|nr:hypothetical protein [Flavobacteriaceae bacterium]|tara:strand:- start:616 stop:1827 length:1212 start_codon:yes stop_codon:yes gene_type:complete
MTQVLFNHINSNHLDTILQQFRKADEVWIATAFLKMSGLNLLLAPIKKHIKNNKPITIIAGQNFGLTEPEALKILLKLFSGRVNANLFLDKAEDKTKVFHPKLFLFKSKDKATIISGSANITKGGLTTNQEVSLCIETKANNTEWKNSAAIFNHIIHEEHANLVNLMLIKRYEQFYKDQKRSRKYQKAIPEKQECEYSFDYTKLEQHLRNFRTEQGKHIFKEREKKYRKAKKLLKEIAESPRLNQNRFEDIIDALVGAAGLQSLWQSGSLYRNRRFVYECKNEFKDLVAFINDHQNKSSSVVFEGAKELVKEVKGANINYVTEIMMTYQPNRFANLNTNPITVLDEEAGVYFKSHSSSFDGNNYSEYCLLTKEIAQKLNLKNMLEVDSFFNEIYWLLKQESKE